MKTDSALIHKVIDHVVKVQFDSSVILASSLIGSYRTAFVEHERTRNAGYHIIGLDAEKALRFVLGQLQMKQG